MTITPATPADPVTVIVVDVETNGLDPRVHQAVEVAWHNLATGATGEFVPPHDWREVVATGELRALRVNRYMDRLVDAPHDVGYVLAIRLWEQFGGPLFQGDHAEERPRARLAAMNPGFDAGFLSRLFAEVNQRTYDGRLDLDVAPWDYHLLDLGNYAAGVLGHPVDAPPLSAGDIADILGVERGDHTAAGDVRAEVECFRRLSAIAMPTEPRLAALPS
jgi:hypothetical protein